MTRWTFVAILAALGLQGCGGAPETLLVKTGMTPAQFSSDGSKCLNFSEKAGEVAGGGDAFLRQARSAQYWRICMDALGYMLHHLTPDQRSAYSKVDSETQKFAFHNALIQDRQGGGEHVAQAKAGLPPAFVGAWSGRSGDTILEIGVTNTFVFGTLKCGGEFARFLGDIEWDGRVTIKNRNDVQIIGGVMPNLAIHSGIKCSTTRLTVAREVNCATNTSSACDDYSTMRQVRRRAKQLAMAGGSIKRGQNAQDLFAAGGPERITGRSGGRGVIVARSGAVVTNYHFVALCKDVRVLHMGKETTATMVFADPTNDLVLLRTDAEFPAAARIARRRPASGAQLTIAVRGGERGDGALLRTMTKIAERTGPNGDTRMFALDIPVHGNLPGAPVVDARGSLVGIAISFSVAAQLTGSRPSIRAMNGFAISSAFVENFLASNNIEGLAAGSDGASAKSTTSPDITVLIRCGDAGVSKSSTPGS